MSALPRPTEIDQTVALDWLRYSLGQGEIISPAALKYIEEHAGHAYTLAAEGVDPARLMKPREGAVITPGTGSPREALARVLETLAERGAACVVVEDELRLKRHPKPSLDGLLLTGFVGEKVIHWAGLEGGAEDGRVAVDSGSGDYPTNAFVTLAPAEALGLVDGADLDPAAVAGTVVGSLMAVIVAAYDAETYIIWEPS
jgi:CBS domain-containing protein